jgi:Zn-dependent protease with chaperone function
MAKLRQIDPCDYVERGTTLQVMAAYVVGAVLCLILTVVTRGVFIIAIFVSAVTYYFRLKVAKAAIHGSAVNVSRKQLADVHEIVDEIAEALDIDTPKVYIVESNQLTASALRLGSTQYVVLVDDLIHGTQKINNPDALRWLIAFELASHALGHTGLIRSQLRAVYTPLARLDVLSCDAVASAVVGKQAGRDALKLLTIGPMLYSQVNDAALDRQALQVEEDSKTKKAERARTHPLILRRLARLVPDSSDE